MSLFEPGYPPPPAGPDPVPDPAFDPVVDPHRGPDRIQLRRTARRLRHRLLAVNAAVGLTALLLGPALGGTTATTVWGGWTVGMLLLAAQAATAVVSAVRYDRACTAQLDPRAAALAAALHREANALHREATGRARP
ncbi:hypothetical protein ACGFX4_19100 [Kitasatospora sp. NPDC048365]|uniref:hypothetical protein n=1 Tax=Kitasatospora sp. NPDC048365 TaxID=3364050 RepID=UPI003722D0FD